jgi:hypothetical protein
MLKKAMKTISEMGPTLLNLKERGLNEIKINKLRLIKGITYLS